MRILQKTLPVRARALTQGFKSTPFPPTDTPRLTTSIPAQAERFAQAVRGHWSIENQLHWRLDATFLRMSKKRRKTTLG